MALACLPGCSGPGFVTEHPVNHQVPAVPAGVYTLQAVDVRPVATKEVEPTYPSELDSVLAGKAVVAFIVRANGRVTDATVVRADDILYGEAAAAAVTGWRFRPAQVKGAPVDCQMTLPFFFDSPYGYDSEATGGTLPSSRPPAPVTRIESH